MYKRKFHKAGVKGPEGKILLAYTRMEFPVQNGKFHNQVEYTEVFASVMGKNSAQTKWYSGFI
jgi:hypothetical protein